MSTGRCREETVQRTWINAFLHSDLALNSTSSSQVYGHTCYVWLFMFSNTRLPPLSSPSLALRWILWDKVVISPGSASAATCTHALCPTLSQTLNSSQVMAQIAAARPAAGVPRDPACESVHCHSAPCVSNGERRGVFPQGIKWMVFLLEGFLRLSFYITNRGKKMWWYVYILSTQMPRIFWHLWNVLYQWWGYVLRVETRSWRDGGVLWKLTRVYNPFISGSRFRA